jgi:peptidoglycan/LPS O-acetylase OafA/YrhL
MAKTIYRIFCVLLALATAGHLFGTFKFFEFGTGIFVWSLSGALACTILVALNVLRTCRPDDRTLRLITLFGNLGWLGIVLLFGQSLGNFLDPRVLFHGITVAGLAFFTLGQITPSRQ